MAHGARRIGQVTDIGPAEPVLGQTAPRRKATTMRNERPTRPGEARSADGVVHRWCARLVVVAVLAVGLAAAAAATAGAALDPSICPPANPIGSGSELLPVAVDDPFPAVANWNSPLDVPAPGVLANDYMPLPGGSTSKNVLAVIWRQPTYGHVTLNRDGSWTFVPTATPQVADLPDETDSFQYVAYDPTSGVCSANPATVRFSIHGFVESPGAAPGAYDDTYPGPPGAEPAIPAGRPFDVAEPGVLANDFDNAVSPPEPARNLVAELLSQPVWLSNGQPAGTITNWGLRRVTAGADSTVTDAPGAFTFTPSFNGYGYASFTYRACYGVTGTFSTACSAPATVLIDVAYSTPAAGDITAVIGSGRRAEVSYAQLLAASRFPTVQSHLWPRFGSAAAGTVTPYYWTGSPLLNADGSTAYDTGDFVTTFYAPGPSFSGQDSFTYRLCDSRTDGPGVTCTNDATITVRAPSPNPNVVSVTSPATATLPFEVRFDRSVRGVSAADVTLTDVTDPNAPVDVPLTLTCWVEVPQYALDGGPLLGADGHQIVERQVQSCDGGTVTLALLSHSAALVSGHAYRVRLNSGTTGITGADGDSRPLDAYDQTVVFTLPDAAAPTAAPSATTPPDAWTKDDVTVDWNWSDGSGSGVDPARCTRSSTSSGEGVQVLTALCSDLRGNVGRATYQVKVDRTGPVANPVLSPITPGGFSNSDVTVTWNWTDAGSGIDPARCPATSTLSGEGLQSVVETCTDVIGNVGSGSASAAVDTVAPVAEPTVSADPGPSGWITARPVTITWNWTDAGSGIDTARCPPTTTILSDGASLVTASCTDRAGNTGHAGDVYHVDTTAPTASPTVSPTPYEGWSKGPVTVTWHWDDVPGTGSGPDPATCPATSSATTSGTVTATCTDLAGNTGTAAQRVDIDTTAPTAAPTTPSGWSRTDVTVLWNWTDTGGSGPDPTVCPVGSTSGGEGTTTLSSSCVDIAGNVATASAVVKVDKTPPALAPTIGPTPLLLGATPVARPNATDALSGVAAQSCTAPKATTLGAGTVTCTATDVAGNTATVTVPYTVGVGIRWAAKPSTMWPDVGLAIGVAAQLTDATGRAVPVSTAQRLGSCAVRFTLGTQAPVCATYVPLTNTFAAVIPTTKRLTVGTPVMLTATAAAGGTTLGTGTAVVNVVRR